jgi:hypothetical protein
VPAKKRAAKKVAADAVAVPEVQEPVKATRRRAKSA